MDFKMTGIRTIATAAFCAISLGAVAQDMPPAGEARDFNIPEPTVVEFENGLRATFVQYGNVPKVTISARVRAGDLNEPEKNGIAGMLASMMEEGTTSRSAQDIAFEAASMGGELAISGDTSEITLGIDVLSEHATKAAELVADVLMNATLPESELARIKQDALRNLSVTLSQPQPQANKAFAKLIYGDHIYGKPYAEEDVLSALTIEDLKAFYDAELGAKRTNIYVVGQFDEAAMKETLAKTLGTWKSGKDMITEVPQTQTALRVHMIDRPGAPQSTLYLGLAVPDIHSADKTALDVMNTMLGGSFISRITANIREDKGYTYSPRSGITDFYGASHWVQRADVTTEATAASLTEIFKEIDRLANEDASEEDVASYKNFRTGVFVLRNATRGGIIGQLANLDFHGLPRERLTNFVADTMAVSAADVKRVTAEYINPAQMTLVLVGDLAKIRESVEKLPQFEEADITVAE
jgi:predicted Zn-dependent peptidase